MIATLLAEYPWLARVGIVIIALVSPFIAAWLRGRRRLAAVLSAVLFVLVAAVTLYPTHRVVLDRCEVAFDPSDLLAIEPLANILLFLLPVLALAAATGRPVLAFLVGVGGSALIELLQWGIPDIGRSCTVTDWVANVTGAALGAIAAAVGIALARRKRA
jgi:hypothetical protein